MEDTAAAYAHLERFAHALRSAAARRVEDDLDRLAFAAEMLRFEESLLARHLETWCASRTDDGGVDETSSLLGTAFRSWHLAADAALEQVRDACAHARRSSSACFERFGEDRGPAGARQLAPAGIRLLTALPAHELWSLAADRTLFDVHSLETHRFDGPRSLELLRRVVDEIARRSSPDQLELLVFLFVDRLEIAVQVASRSELEPLSALLLHLSTIDCFAGHHRFERFVGMVDSFLERCSAFGVEPSRFDDRWSILRDDGSTERPVSLPLERLAARRGLRPTHYACHRHPLVAAEVVPHIHRVTDLLEPANVSPQVLQHVLRRHPVANDDLFRLLAHPACPRAWALRRLEQLEAQELHRLIRTPGTQLALKRRALRLLGGRPTVD